MFVDSRNLVRTKIDIFKVMHTVVLVNHADNKPFYSYESMMVVGWDIQNIIQNNNVPVIQ